MAGNTSDEILDKMPEWFRILRNVIMENGKDGKKGVGAADGHFGESS